MEMENLFRLLNRKPAFRPESQTLFTRPSHLHSLSGRKLSKLGPISGQTIIQGRGNFEVPPVINVSRWMGRCPYVRAEARKLEVNINV